MICSQCFAVRKNCGRMKLISDLEKQQRIGSRAIQKSLKMRPNRITVVLIENAEENISKDSKIAIKSF